MNLVNTVNSVNIVDFNVMRYKKQYNDSPQVVVNRQTGNSIEKENFSAMYQVYKYETGNNTCSISFETTFRRLLSCINEFECECHKNSFPL